MAMIIQEIEIPKLPIMASIIQEIEIQSENLLKMQPSVIYRMVDNKRIVIQRFEYKLPVVLVQHSTSVLRHLF